MGNSQTGNAAPANYKLGNQVDASTASLFKLHEATNADTGEKASAFVFTSIPGNDAAFTLVQNSIKKASKYANGIVSGNSKYDGLLKVYVVKQQASGVEIYTEPVAPLSSMLDSMIEEEIHVGLFTIARTLQLLHSQNTAHCNISTRSIFVSTKNRGWKLALDFATALSADEWALLHATQSWQSQNACPPEFAQKSKAMPQYPIWARDSYAFGVLLEEIGANIKEESDMHNLIVRMKAADPLARPNFTEILISDYFASNIIKAMQLCMSIRDRKSNNAQESKDDFAALVNLLDGFKSEVIARIFAPQLLRTTVVCNSAFRKSGLEIRLFKPRQAKGGGYLPIDLYRKTVKPFIAWGWRLKSHPSLKAVKTQLIRSCPYYIAEVDSDLIEQVIFNELCDRLKSPSDDITVAALVSLPTAIEKIGAGMSKASDVTHQIFSLLSPSGYAKQTTASPSQIPAPRSVRVRKMAIACLLNIIRLLNHSVSFLADVINIGVSDPAPEVRRMTLYKLQVLVTSDAPISRSLSVGTLVNLVIQPAVTMLTDPDQGVRDRARKTIKKLMTVLEARDTTFAKGAIGSPAASATKTTVDEWDDWDDEWKEEAHRKESFDFSPSVKAESRPNRNNVPSPTSATTSPVAKTLDAVLDDAVPMQVTNNDNDDDFDFWELQPSLKTSKWKQGPSASPVTTKPIASNPQTSKVSSTSYVGEEEEIGWGDDGGDSTQLSTSVTTQPRSSPLSSPSSPSPSSSKNQSPMPVRKSEHPVVAPAAVNFDEDDWNGW